MARNDKEAELEAWLDQVGVANSWELAPGLAYNVGPGDRAHVRAHTDLVILSVTSPPPMRLRSAVKFTCRRNHLLSLTNYASKRAIRCLPIRVTQRLVL